MSTVLYLLKICTYVQQQTKMYLLHYLRKVLFKRTYTQTLTFSQNCVVFGNFIYGISVHKQESLLENITHRLTNNLWTLNMYFFWHLTQETIHFHCVAVNFLTHTHTLKPVCVQLFIYLTSCACCMRYTRRHFENVRCRIAGTTCIDFKSPWTFIIYLLFCLPCHPSN